MNPINKIYKKGSLMLPNITDEKGVKGIKAIEFYKQRMLTILGNSDYAIMPENTIEYNKTLGKIYKELNIEFINPDNIIYVKYNGNLTHSILHEIINIKGELPKYIKNILPFINSKKVDKISQILNLKTSRDSISSEIINDKGIAQSELRELGVTTPEGKVVYSEEQAETFFHELKNKGYEIITFKLKRAASGMGVYKIKDIDELEETLHKHKSKLKEGILLDGWIQGKFISSPNIQYYVGKTPNEDIFIGCSEQILSSDGTVHLGNTSNLSILENKKLQKDLKTILDWVRSKKAFGIIGIDFVIFEDSKTKEKKAYFMEINGRINGSTHGPIIANKIYGKNFQDKWAVMNNVYLPKNWTINTFIQELQKDRIYYDPSKKQGVIPTNLSAIDKYSKAMVSIIGSPEFRQETMKILQTYNKQNVKKV